MNSGLKYDIKWMLVDFFKENYPMGDSNIEHKHANGIVDFVIEAILKRLEGLEPFKSTNHGMVRDDFGFYLDRTEVFQVIKELVGNE